MKKLMNKILSMVLALWSYSVILAFTDDVNFGTIEYTDSFRNDIREPRFSLINIMMGSKIVYLFTVDIKRKKVSLFYSLSLESIFVLKENEMAEITERYSQHLNERNNEDIEIERESLCYRIDNEEKRIDKSSEKINLYATIILTVLPLLLAIIDLKKFLYFNIAEKVVLFIMIYAVMNAIMYIFQSIKIQKIEKSAFSKLRTSVEHNKEINKQYQYDWQYLRKNADLAVSYVKNLQIWIAGAIGCVIIIVVINLGGNYIGQREEAGLSRRGEIATIILDELENPYSESSINLTQINIHIQQRTTRSIAIIVNEEENTRELIDELQTTYGELDIKVYRDNTLEKNILKIMEEN